MASPPISAVTRLAPAVALGLLLSWVALPSAAQDSITPEQHPKMALLIGNADYDENGTFTPANETPEDRLPDLRNPCNDVMLIESKLIRLGWDEHNVITLCNAKKIDIIEAIQDFTQNYMSGVQPFGFIYYSGHGVQVDADTYIFGVDTQADIDKAVDRYHRNPHSTLFVGGIRLREEILDEIGDPGNGSILLVLDACRENPIVEAMARRGITIGGPRRGARPAPGLKMLFSTADGDLAGDGAGGNSPFATIFARNMMSEPSVDYLIRSVVYDVYQETSDPQKRARLFTNIVQLPDEVGTLQRPPPDVCFTNCG
jgi:uncharacterized caspase-like protein